MKLTEAQIKELEKDQRKAKVVTNSVVVAEMEHILKYVASEPAISNKAFMAALFAYSLGYYRGQRKASANKKAASLGKDKAASGNVMA